MGGHAEEGKATMLKRAWTRTQACWRYGATWAPRRPRGAWRSGAASRAVLDASGCNGRPIGRGSIPCRRAPSGRAGGRQLVARPWQRRGSRRPAPNAAATTRTGQAHENRCNQGTQPGRRLPSLCAGRAATAKPVDPARQLGGKRKREVPGSDGRPCRRGEGADCQSRMDQDPGSLEVWGDLGPSTATRGVAQRERGEMREAREREKEKERGRDKEKEKERAKREREKSRDDTRKREKRDRGERKKERRRGRERKRRPRPKWAGLTTGVQPAPPKMS